MTVLVTGAAGFIGFFVARRLLAAGETVVGVDNLNNYYNVNLKYDRLHQLEGIHSFTFIKADIAHREAMQSLFSKWTFDAVIHLAAQAGVRYSIENPIAYSESNLSGFLHILEGCRQQQVGHLIFASSSSVYGSNRKVPFAVTDNVDHPVSLYAATKKANELMAHAYSHLYGIPSTGLRFFTVYGPWGRPDMAYFKFVDAINNNFPIEVYNHGNMKRDFTYIDDVVEGIVRLLHHPPSHNSDNSKQALTSAPYKIYNIGNNHPVTLIQFIEIIEQTMKKPAQKHMKPMQPGDVPITCADVEELKKTVGFSPSTPIEIGIKYFVDWYQSYYALTSAEKTSCLSYCNDFK